MACFSLVLAVGTTVLLAGCRLARDVLLDASQAHRNFGLFFRLLPGLLVAAAGAYVVWRVLQKFGALSPP